MGDYEHAAELYDLLYADKKDYRAEAEVVASVVRRRCPEARSLLDVGCGTGEHARHLTEVGFEVDGADLEPAFVEIAGRKCPGGRFVVADMTTLDLPGRYDVVTSLFSAIGYVRTLEGLHRAVARMGAHLSAGGVLVVDPWFEPGQLSNHHVTVVTGRTGDVVVSRVSRTVLDGTISSLEFEYLVGRPEGIERRSEVHRLGMFTQAEMEEAFRAAGLDVERLPEEAGTRGLYVGMQPRRR